MKKWKKETREEVKNEEMKIRNKWGSKKWRNEKKKGRSKKWKNEKRNKKGSKKWKNEKKKQEWK